MNSAEFGVHCRDYEYEVSGKLHLHSETGTEGGYWALQDANYIKKVAAVDGVFDNAKVYDPIRPERMGR